MTTLRGSFTHFLIIWVNFSMSFGRYKQYELANQELQLTDNRSILHYNSNISKMEREAAYAKFLINEGIKYGFFILDKENTGNISISMDKLPQLETGFTVKIDMENYYKTISQGKTLNKFPRYVMAIGREFENGPPKGSRPDTWHKADFPNCYYTHIVRPDFKKFHKIIPLDVNLFKFPFTKGCEYCKNQFLTLNNRQKYCFPGCKQNASILRKLDSNRPEEVYCPICNEPFWNRAGKKTCGKAKCKKALQRKRGEIT